MGLVDIVRKDMIIVPLTSSTREAVIHDLVDCYCRGAGLGPEAGSQIEKAVLDREAVASTAMEKGIAIPHAKIPFLKESALVIGISRLPVDFGGAEKTNIFFLVLANGENPTEHIQILSSVAKLCSSDVFVRMLASSKSADDVYQLFFD